MARAEDTLELNVVLEGGWKRAVRGGLSAFWGIVSLGYYAPAIPRERILVRCKRSGRLIGEIPENWGDTVPGVEALRARVARDLETLTPEEFSNAWGIDASLCAE